MSFKIGILARASVTNLYCCFNLGTLQMPYFISHTSVLIMIIFLKNHRLLSYHSIYKIMIPYEEATWIKKFEIEFSLLLKTALLMLHALKIYAIIAFTLPPWLKFISE